MKNIIYAMKAIMANYVADTKGTILLLLMLVCISMTSCIVSQDARITQIEIMKPAIVNFPETIKTVALINSASNRKVNQPFKYSNQYNYKPDTESDTTIKYQDLSNTCIDALAWVLKKRDILAM